MVDFSGFGWGSYMRFFFPLNTCPIGPWGHSFIFLQSPLPQYSHLRISPIGSALSQSLSCLFHFLLQNLLWNFMQEVRRTAHKTLPPSWPPCQPQMRIMSTCSFFCLPGMTRVSGLGPVHPFCNMTFPFPYQILPF